MLARDSIFYLELLGFSHFAEHICSWNQWSVIIFQRNCFRLWHLESLMKNVHQQTLAITNILKANRRENSNKSSIRNIYKLQILRNLLQIFYPSAILIGGISLGLSSTSKCSYSKKNIFQVVYLATRDTINNCQAGLRVWSFCDVTYTLLPVPYLRLFLWSISVLYLRYTTRS